MATYQKRGRRWRVQVRIAGESESATFATKAAARDWAATMEADIERGELRSAQTLAAVMRRYADTISIHKGGAKWERNRVDLFARTMAFAERRVGDVTPADIAAWRDQRLRIIASASVRRDLTLLASIFEQCRREWRLCRDNPVRDVRKPSHSPARSRLFDDAEIKAICDALAYQRGIECRMKKQLAGAAFDLSLETGMRAGEIRSLCAATVHIDQRYVELPRTKNGTRREVALSPAAVRILRSLDPQTPFPISGGTLAGLFRRGMRDAGVVGATFHDARATAITRLAKQLDIHDLARMIGHTDLNSLLIYYRTSAAEIADRLHSSHKR